jgi:hypothetical protein
MRTYSHGVIAYLLYAKGSSRQRWLAAAGGVLPDVFIGTGFIFHVAEPRTSLPIVAQLHALLHHSELHTITVALHSFLLAGPLLALAWLFYRAAAPFFVGMLSHAVVDFLTHRTWAYNHFYPVPLPPVRGVVSYTDPVFTVVEHAALLLLVVWFVGRRMRTSTARGAA